MKQAEMKSGEPAATDVSPGREAGRSPAAVSRSGPELATSEPSCKPPPEAENDWDRPLDTGRPQPLNDDDITMEQFRAVRRQLFNGGRKLLETLDVMRSVAQGFLDLIERNGVTTFRLINPPDADPETVRRTGEELRRSMERLMPKPEVIPPEILAEAERVRGRARSR
jgi:hypothetical protein